MVFGPSMKPIKIAKQLFNTCQGAAVAVYLGGSRVDKYIRHPHDYDFIVVGANRSQCAKCERYLRNLSPSFTIGDVDFIQIRNAADEERRYGSYINKMMVLLVGQPVEFHFDVIHKDRSEYIQILKNYCTKLQNHPQFNQKRWYQLYRGTHILLNNSYQLSDKEQMILNHLHDMDCDCTQYINELILAINQL